MKTSGYKLLLTALLATGVLGSAMASETTKATMTAADEQAAANYKLARAQCDSLNGNPKDICIAQAKAARIQVEANAKAEYKNTVGALADARKDIANANYEVEKTKCGSQTGNAKDVCVKEAKSVMIASIADAKSAEKVSGARADARDDKQDALYKVAVEKCGAQNGNAKDDCIANAKTKYGK